MRNARLAWTWSLIFGFLCVVVAQRAAAQGTSTPEERARWAEITHKLESNPLDEGANKDGEWALNRLSEGGWPTLPPRRTERLSFSGAALFGF
jgi:hypothetical protein